MSAKFNLSNESEFVFGGIKMNSYVKQMVAVGCGVIVANVLVEALKRMHRNCPCKTESNKHKEGNDVERHKCWHKESCCSEEAAFDVNKFYRDGFSDGWQSGYDCAMFEHNTPNSADFDSDTYDDWDWDDDSEDWLESDDDLAEPLGLDDDSDESNDWDDSFSDDKSDLFADTVDAVNVLNTAAYDDKCASLFSESGHPVEAGTEGDMEDALEEEDLSRLENILGVNKDTDEFDEFDEFDGFDELDEI